MNKRVESRVPISIRVRYTEPAGDVREGFTAMLGTGGCFILSTDPLSEGVIIRLDFILGNNKRSITVGGKVVWKRTDENGSRQAGFGVQFKTLSPKDKDAIEQFVESVLMRKT